MSVPRLPLFFRAARSLEIIYPASLDHVPVHRQFHRLSPHARPKSLDASFSKVRFDDIAPLVGLDPGASLRDTPLFPVCRARVTNSLFARVVEDIHIATNNFGFHQEHDNGEARSRAVAPVRCPPLSTRSSWRRRVCDGNSSSIVLLPDSGCRSKIHLSP